MMTTLVNAAKKQNSDFSSFQILYIGGSAVPITLVEELKVCNSVFWCTDAVRSLQRASYTVKS